MKKLILPGLGILAFLILFQYPANGQISKNLLFDKTNIERKTIKKNSRDYEQLLIKNASQTHDVGKPSLPLLHYTFYIPKGQKVTGVIYESEKEDEVYLTSEIMPAQHFFNYFTYGNHEVKVKSCII